ncbi:hypothetical protein Tco_1022440 [Tanacetum coccineum]
MVLRRRYLYHLFGVEVEFHRGRSLLLLVIVNTASLHFLLLEFIICIELHGGSQAVPISDKGKGIATESDKDPSKKLVPASTIVHPDPDEEVKVPYMINGKMYYLTDTEMQAYMDKEEKLRKAAEEARLLAITKHESPENARFNIKLKKLIAEHPDQEKLESKKVKLEALGYEMN